MPPDVSAQAERRCDSVCPQLADGFIVAEQAQQVQPLTESLQTHPLFICRDAFAAPSELARTCSLSPEMPKGCTPPVTFRTSGKPLAPAVAKHFFCRAQDLFTLSSAPQHKRRFFSRQIHDLPAVSLENAELLCYNKSESICSVPRQPGSNAHFLNRCTPWKAKEI